MKVAIEGHSLRTHVISATINKAVESIDVTERRGTNLSSSYILLNMRTSPDCVSGIDCIKACAITRSTQLNTALHTESFKKIDLNLS